MEARDLITLVRRRAGLTQAELAARLGLAQPAIARWERGRGEPSYRAVQEVMRACGVEQSIKLYPYDGSDIATAYTQLQLEPVERLALAEGGRADLLSALEVIAASDLRLLVAGEAAAVLQGSPLSAHRGVVEVVCHPSDLERAHVELGAAAVRVLDTLPGTRGYRDLAAGATVVDIDAELDVTCVGLLDLLRIALSDRDDPAAGRKAGALHGALLAERAAQRTPSPTLSDEQARDRVEQWLSRQK